jgi:hypothetical protein
MEKEQELRESAESFLNKYDIWESQDELEVRNYFIDFAKSEAAKNYHQSEADREIERLKDQIKVCHESEERAQIGGLEAYNELQKKYDSLKEKSTCLEKALIEWEHQLIIGSCYYEMPYFAKNALTKYRKEAKDGE